MSEVMHIFDLLVRRLPAAKNFLRERGVAFREVNI